MSTRTAVTVRRGTPADLAAVAALEHELFGRDAWSAALLAPLLSQSAGSCLVAELDDTVVGHVIACAAGDVVDLQRLGVRVQHRRRGLGRRLLAEVLAEVCAADRRVLVEVSADNHDALAFYAAEGFTEIDRRPHYYRDGSDAIVMLRGRADREKSAGRRRPASRLPALSSVDDASASPPSSALAAGRGCAAGFPPPLSAQPLRRGVAQ